MKNKISLTRKEKQRAKMNVIVPSEDVVNVEKFVALRSSEVQMMEMAIKESSDLKVSLPQQRLPHHLRRRANSSTPKVKKNRIRNLKNRKNNNNGKWLDTHVWHAKRMHMGTLFGYKLAIKPTLKCYKALIRASKFGCAIYDKSYYKVVKITHQIAIFVDAHLVVCIDNENVQFLKDKNSILGEIYCIHDKDSLIMILHPMIYDHFNEELMSYNPIELPVGVFELYGQQASIYARSVLIPTTETHFSSLNTFPSCLDNQYFNFACEAFSNSPPQKIDLELKYQIMSSDSTIDTSQFTVINTSWHQLNRLTILVPQMSIKPLWRSLIFCGVYACGLENIRSFYFEQKLPFFPFDYPICMPLGDNIILPKLDVSGILFGQLHKLKASNDALYWCFIIIHKGTTLINDKIYFKDNLIGNVTTTQFHQSVGQICCIGLCTLYINKVEVVVGDDKRVGMLYLIN